MAAARMQVLSKSASLLWKAPGLRADFCKRGFSQICSRAHFKQSPLLRDTQGIVGPRVLGSYGISFERSDSPVFKLPYSKQPCRSYSEKKTTALTLIKDLKHLGSSPTPALVFGLSGLIPFIAAPGYMIMTGTFVSAFAVAQTAYGACILSFIGGIRWGNSLQEDGVVQPDWFNLGYSVTPSLVACTALLLPTSLGLLTLIGGLSATAYMDAILWGSPPWFKALRFLLSVFAILSLWTTLMCRLMLSDKKKPPKEKPVAEVKTVKVETPAVVEAVQTAIEATETDAGEHDVVKTEQTGSEAPSQQALPPANEAK